MFGISATCYPQHVFSQQERKMLKCGVNIAASGLAPSLLSYVSIPPSICVYIPFSLLSILISFSPSPFVSLSLSFPLILAYPIADVLGTKSAVRFWNQWGPISGSKREEKEVKREQNDAVFGPQTHCLTKPQNDVILSAAISSRYKDPASQHLMWYFIIQGWYHELVMAWYYWYIDFSWNEVNHCFYGRTHHKTSSGYNISKIPFSR